MVCIRAHTPRTRAWVVWPLWALFCLLPDALFLVQERVPVTGDSLTSNLPLKYLTVQQLGEGWMPLWTSKLGSGSPLLADTIGLPFDPRNLWWALLPPWAAYWAMLLTSRIAAGWICLAYFRRRHQLGPWQALTATAVYFCGTMFLEEFRLHSTAVILELFPCFLWLTERLLDRPNYARTLALALGWAAGFFIGSVAYLVYLPVFALVWAAGLWWFQQPRPSLVSFLRFGVLFAVALLWAGGFCAITFLPFVELTQLSNRGGEYPVDPFALRSTLFALLGSHRPSALVPSFNHFFYVGVASLPVLWFSCWQKHNVYLRLTPKLVLLTLAGLIILTSPLKPFLVRYLPVLATVAFFRLSFFWGFLAAVLVGHGLQPSAAVRDGRLPRWAGWSVSRLHLGLAVSLVVCLAWIYTSASPSSDIGRTLLGLLLPLVTSSFVVLLGYRALALGLLFRQMVRGTAQTALGCGLILGELVLTWTLVRDGERIDDLFPVTAEVAYLQRHNDPDYRCSEVLLPSLDQRDPHLKEDAYRSLCLDAAGVHGLRTANLYESLIIREQDRFMRHYQDLAARRRSFPRAPNAIMMTSVSQSPLLDVQAVRYLLARRRLPPQPDQHLCLEGRAFLVYERTDPLPRAYFVPRARCGSADQVHAWLEELASCSEGQPPVNLRQEVLLEADAEPAPSPNRPTTTHALAGRMVADHDREVEVAISCPEAGYLVLSDTFCPGWHATVDGQPVTIFRANGFVRAVRVGPGDHHVLFRYEPASWVWGVRLSLATLAFTVAASAGVWLVARRRRRQDVVADAAQVLRAA